MYNLLRSELMWWQHHEGTDQVRANVQHTFDLGGGKTQTMGQDLEPPLSDKAMDEYAKTKEGKSAWDNDTVAAFASAQLNVPVTRLKAAEPEEAAADTPPTPKQ